ncbi:unnamed protein product [Moneuplotes crassus]|uniref:Uncharacterized protein n=1 Tax=Euplotes crassus TaxID=5936 RepID=A0AAD2CVK2_EUPCR|nr:unnamed protein product [Moneuplotes crassus]
MQTTKYLPHLSRPVQSEPYIFDILHEALCKLVIFLLHHLILLSLFYSFSFFDSSCR